MSYHSFWFFVFTAGVLLLYYILGRRSQKYIMCLSNTAFFVIAGSQHLPFVVAATLISFFTAKKIGQIWDETDAILITCNSADERKRIRFLSKKRAKKSLLLALCLLVGTLVICKYTNFAINTINSVLQKVSGPRLNTVSILLPIGISFYTFMAIGYVLDVYWKRYKAENDLISFYAFLSWFPHVVQGPIDRYDKFRAQVSEGVTFSYRNMAFGSQLVIWGLFKKLVIADRLAFFVNTIFDNYLSYKGLIVLLAAFVYSIQIYADFSGCIDIVSGVSEMFGIRLAKNFNHPYFAKTMPEFWRRWHTSLMEWFKDYIYFPVSSSESVKRIKRRLKADGRKRFSDLFGTCFPALIVWLITGIWHGAAWKYLIWGLYHASLIILGNVFNPKIKEITDRLKIDTTLFGWRFWQMCRTFFLCSIGRFFFRAENVGASFVMIRNIFKDQFALSSVFTSKLFSFGLDRANTFVALAAIIVLFAVDRLGERVSIRETIAKQSIIFRWLIYYVLLFAVLIYGIYGPGYNASEFIYGQF